MRPRLQHKKEVPFKYQRWWCEEMDKDVVRKLQCRRGWKPSTHTMALMIDNFWCQLKIQWDSDGDDDDNGGDGEIKRDDEEGNKDESTPSGITRSPDLFSTTWSSQVGLFHYQPSLVGDNWWCWIERTGTVYTAPALSIKPLQYHMVTIGGYFPGKSQTRKNMTDLSSSLNSLYCSVGS